MKSKGSLIIWGLVAGAAFLAGYMLLGGGGSMASKHKAPDIVVDIALVGQTEFVDVIEAIGTALANESVTLTARVSETIQSVKFTDNMMVTKGTVIVAFTSEEERAQLAEAEAAITEAQQAFDRIADLVNRGNASRAALDTATRNLDQARYRYAASKARVEDRLIRAPFDGVLGLRQVSEGTLVSPGTAITTLDDTSRIKLDFSVPEAFMSALRAGIAIDAMAAAYPERIFKGVIASIDSRVDPVTRAVKVRALLPNDDNLIKPGMLMVVRLMSNQRSVLAVPEEAVFSLAAEQFVFVVNDDNTVTRQRITIGARKPGWAEILGGVPAGERVVSSGIIRLRDGAKVRERGSPKAATPNS